MITSWGQVASPLGCDYAGMLEILSILPTKQDFRARMPEKRGCAMDGGQALVRPVWILLRRMLRISYIPKLEHPRGLAAWFQRPGNTIIASFTPLAYLMYKK